MNMIESVTTCLSKYFSFEGVATRPEYWWFQLFYFIVVIVGIVLDGNSTNYWNQNYGYWEIIFTLLFLTPAISVSCRRLHDLGKSGWWQLIGITVIGYIPLIYWFCKEGGVASKYASE